MTELIAEIGQYHDGSIDRLWNLVSRLCKTDVDTIKLQHHIASAESSEGEAFRVQFSKQYSSRYDYWRAMEIPLEVLQKVKTYCENREKEFLCTPFSLQAIDELESIGVNRFKIGSADVSNTLMLKHLKSLKKPVILSNGLRDFNELTKAVDLLQTSLDLTLLHCTTSYPTRMGDVGWAEIDKLKKRFPDHAIGLSDHTGSIWPAIFAIGEDLKAVELHVAFSRDDFGPDTSSSVTFEELEKITEARSAWLEMNGEISVSKKSELAEVKKIFSRSVRLRQDLSVGDVLETRHIETFKPSGMGPTVTEVDELLGRKSLINQRKGDIISVDDFQ